jgi:hypothetical protein
MQTLPAGKDGKPNREKTGKIGLSLFDLDADPKETNNVADANPDIVSRMLKLIEVGRSNFGDSLTNRAGSQIRPPGKVNR